MTRTRNWRVSALLAALIVAPGAVTAHGQASQEQGYAPPVVRFADGGISLLEAVRITLENSPDIKLQAATYLLQTGVVQEQRGAFDWSFEGSVSYEYRQQELTDTVKKAEREKREELAKITPDDVRRVSDTIGALDSAVGNNGTVSCEASVCSAEFLSQYQFMTDLIEAFGQEPGNEQLISDLVDARNALVQREQENLRESLSQLESDLAANVEQLGKLGETPKDEVIRNGKFQVGLSRTFRTGFQLNPFFDSTYEGSNFKGKPIEPDLGGKGVEDLFNSRVGINFTFPLLRGRGRDQVAAGERSAEIEREAKLASLQHQASLSVLRTIQAYWGLRAAQDRLDVEELSVSLQERLVTVTGDLVAAGELAGVEEARNGASRSRSQARLEDARRALSAARVGLAKAMGVAVTAEDDTLPLASDEFPALGGSMLPPSGALVGVVSTALEARRDLQASRHLAESGQVLTRASELDQRALLDLTGSTWMTALGEKSYGKSIENWVGPSVSAELKFEMPIGNNQREGRYAQSRADLQTREINLADLERIIELSVVNEIRALESAVEAVRLAQQSVGFYESLVDAQFDLLRAGEISVVDAILTEDQQAAAQRDLVAARGALARIIAQLRFEMGGLVSYDGDTSQIIPGALTTLPSWQ